MRHEIPNAITPNLILRKAKRLLGIKTFKLPFDDDELLEIMMEDTLPTFSKYFPRYLTFPINLSKCRRAKYRVADNDRMNNRKAYHLDLSQFGSDIVPIDIEDIDYNYSNLSDDIMYQDMIQGSGSPYDIMTNSFGRATVVAGLNNEPIHRFEAPDILILDRREYGEIFGGSVYITFLVLHSADLSTINLSYIDYFTKLYMIDLQISLYETLKHCDKIDTTFGEIDLKIDDWQDAKSKREELEESWNGKFIRHRRKTIRKV